MDLTQRKYKSFSALLKMYLAVPQRQKLTGFSYDRILNRVSNDLDSKVALAKKVLGWMTCARRPLKWHEIQGALSTNTTDRTVDFVQHRSRVHIREICGSLISNLSGDRLELVHVSAKE
jgi:hypothetical protein